jgi:hypothetical protein
MIKHTLYDISVAEVRGQASQEEKNLLNSNVFAWRDALQQVVDEVESQFILKSEEFEDHRSRLLLEDAPEEVINDLDVSHNLWKSRARTFKKHVNARLLAVKRMCQEATNHSEAVGLDIEKALDVVDAAIEVVEADAVDDEIGFDDAFNNLIVIVNNFKLSRE